MKKLAITLFVFSMIINAWSQTNKLIDDKFSGPINAVFVNTKEAWIYPTKDMDAALLKDYVSKVFNRFKSDGSILISDSAALTLNLSDYGLLVYGTMTSNIYLTHYKTSFPFTIENNYIQADNTYRDEKTKFITCLPNPQNNKKGMAIFTGFSNKNIIGINSIFNGPEDYVISINYNKDNLSKGNYDKSGINWKFVKE